MSTTVRQNGGKYSTEQIKERNFLNKESKKLEDSSFVTIPDDLPDLLQEDLDIWNSTESNVNGGMVRKVKVAAFQADSLISCRYIHNKSNLIIGNDTDFAALVGKGALVIRNFKFNRDLGGHNRSRIETM